MASRRVKKLFWSTLESRKGYEHMEIFFKKSIRMYITVVEKILYIHKDKNGCCDYKMGFETIKK